jgi:hypothetical protein
VTLAYEARQGGGAATWRNIVRSRRHPYGLIRGLRGHVRDIEKDSADGDGTATESRCDTGESVLLGFVVCAWRGKLMTVPVYYLYLPGGFPAVARDDDLDWYRRHPLLGAYDDARALWHAYDLAHQEALERIQRYGRPNLVTDGNCDLTTES